MSRIFLLLFATLATVNLLVEAAPADQAEESGDPSEDFPDDEVSAARGYMMTNVVGPGAVEWGLTTKHWKFFSKMLDDCGAIGGLEACVGSKAVAFADSFLNQESIPIYEGVALVKRKDSQQEEDAEKLSERQGVNGTDIDEGIAQKMVNRVTRFLRNYSVQLRLPVPHDDEVAYGLDEGRKLKKTLLPIIMGVGLKVLGVLPLLFGGLALLAGNALFVSKLAFVLASLVALSGVMNGVRDLGGFSQKIRIPGLSQLASALPGASPTSSYSAPSWDASSSYSTNTNGWSRSMDAHQMAYAAQSPEAPQ